MELVTQFSTLRDIPYSKEDQEMAKAIIKNFLITMNNVFLAEILGVGRSLISDFAKDRPVSVKASHKITGAVLKLEDEKELFKKVELLFERRSLRTISTVKGRRRSKSVSSDSMSSVFQSLGVKWPFDHYIQPGIIRLVERERKPNDSKRQPQTLSALLILAGIQFPYKIESNGDGEISIIQTQISTNPFAEFMQLPNNKPKNPFLEVDEDEISVENIGQRKAVTPEPDKMPPNYVTSTFSTIQKSKLPKFKKI